MLYKSLFIIQATVKDLLISYNVVQKLSNSVTKVGVAHAQQPFKKHPRFQVLVQINVVPRISLKSKQTRNK